MGSAVFYISQLHCGYWKIVEGECVLESVHLQRVEGTPCQSGGCSHTEGSESLRSGSCIIESEVTACGAQGPADVPLWPD